MLYKDTQCVMLEFQRQVEKVKMEETLSSAQQIIDTMLTQRCLQKFVKPIQGAHKILELTCQNDCTVNKDLRMKLNSAQ